MRGYTTRDVAELLGMSAAKIRSFARAGFISAGRGRRGEHRFRLEDVVLLRAAKELGDSRIHSRNVWRALRQLKNQLPKGQSLASVRITAEGDRIVVRDRATSWIPDSGQQTFDFAVAELADQAVPMMRRQADEARSARDLSSEEWFELGLDLETASALADAKRAYRTATEIDSGNADAHVNLGRLWHEEGKAERAAAHYRSALATAPDHATAAFNLGIALDDLGATQEAVDAYKSALEIVPEFADAHFNLAELYEKRGERAAAVRHLTAYRKLTARG